MGMSWEEAEVAAQKSKQIRMASECGPMGDFTFWISPWLSLLAETKH